MASPDGSRALHQSAEQHLPCTTCRRPAAGRPPGGLRASRNYPRKRARDGAPLRRRSPGLERRTIRIMLPEIRDPTVSVEEYLQELSVNTVGWSMTEQLLGLLPVVLGSIRKRYGGGEPPEVRIVKSAELQAEGGPYALRIYIGLLEFALGLRYALPPVVAELEGVTIDASSIPGAFFLWAVAHEQFHALRRHNNVAARYRDPAEGEAALSQAIERDADLCAVAEVYRMNQWPDVCPGASDRQVKIFTMYCLFWAIRTLPKPIGDSHMGTAERMWHVMVKLATLKADGSPPDFQCQEDDTLEMFRALALCVVQCERAYLRDIAPGEPSIVGDLQYRDRDVVQLWDRIYAEMFR